jgi:uncharacterized protein with NRDE domain
MCTVTVLRGADRLLVTMNRDERRRRAEELAPRQAGGGGRPAWIGPGDGAKGGTWFGANDRGLVACLLNAYAAGDLALLGRDDLPSRGEIIPQLLEQTPEQARAWLRSGFDPSPFPSFSLVVVAPGWGETYSWRLDQGIAVSAIPEGWSMVSSSLWRSGEVVAWRQARFDEWLREGAREIEGVPAFNLLEAPGRREWSPLMTRPVSITRSLTQAELRAGETRLTMRYWRRDGESPIAPHEPTAVAELELAEASTAS